MFAAIGCHLPSEVISQCGACCDVGQIDQGVLKGVQDGTFTSVAEGQLEINKGGIALPVYSFLSRRQAVILKGANYMMVKTI